MIFGTLYITQLLITSTTISFLSSQMVFSEVFCGEFYQYSHQYTYQRTYLEHPIPAGMDKCLIRIFDGINTLIKYIEF